MQEAEHHIVLDEKNQEIARLKAERDAAVRTGKFASLEVNRLAQQERAERAEAELEQHHECVSKTDADAAVRRSTEFWQKEYDALCSEMRAVVEALTIKGQQLSRDHNERLAAYWWHSTLKARKAKREEK